jgi:hypothetical protein
LPGEKYISTIIKADFTKNKPNAIVTHFNLTEGFFLKAKTAIPNKAIETKKRTHMVKGSITSTQKIGSLKKSHIAAK